VKTPPQLPFLTFICKLGEGGMSSVWKAFDIRHEEMLAVKILNREQTARPDDIELFQAEARTMSEINHVGIVRSYELNCHDGWWYYTMEYVDGYSFSSLLKRKQHLPEADCLLICESVAVALDYAWNDFGVVHCDIKPDNIMINSDGTVKLTDLGLCHTFQYLAEGTQRIPDQVMGTPAYISPEQVFGDVEPDCRTDIYSLAATLYHLSTGRIIFPGLGYEEMLRAHCDENCAGHDPRFYRPELSEGFCQMLEAMLVKNRDYRIPSWNDVYEMCLAVERGSVFKHREGTASSLRLALSGAQYAEQAGLDAASAPPDGYDAIPGPRPVPQPKKHVMRFFTHAGARREPQIQIDPETGRKVLVRHKAVNAGFKVHKPVTDW